jgi:hypothetical protein
MFIDVHPLRDNTLPVSFQGFLTNFKYAVLRLYIKPPFHRPCSCIRYTHTELAAFKLKAGSSMDELREQVKYTIELNMKNVTCHGAS